MSATREYTTLSELEVSATGGAARLFRVKLEDGSTVFISFQAVNFHGLECHPHSPSPSQIHESVSILASAKPLGR